MSLCEEDPRLGLGTAYIHTEYCLLVVRRRKSLDSRSYLVDRPYDRIVCWPYALSSPFQPAGKYHVGVDE